MYQQVLLNSRYTIFEEVKGNFPTWSKRYAELIRPTENPSDETHPEGEWLDEWMQASAMAPNFRALEDTDLCRCDIDKNHPLSRFINTLRQAVQDSHDSSSSTSIPSLSRQKQSAHDLILDSLRSNSTIRLIIIAFNIGGSSIHHELDITVDKNFKNTKFIIIDEYSMIGRKMLAYIDLRLRDIFGTKESFRNFSIILVVISLTLSINNVFALNKFSGSMELRSQNIEKLCRD
ncbi:hypothetical protein MKX03_023186 [Papaver bracteatum]|nr:hypothetical protein MKX03_023186 [Papaver bracteatum]